MMYEAPFNPKLYPTKIDGTDIGTTKELNEIVTKIIAQRERDEKELEDLFAELENIDDIEELRKKFQQTKEQLVRILTNTIMVNGINQNDIKARFKILVIESRYEEILKIEGFDSFKAEIKKFKKLSDDLMASKRRFEQSEIRILGAMVAGNELNNIFFEIEGEKDSKQIKLKVARLREAAIDMVDEVRVLESMSQVNDGLGRATELLNSMRFKSLKDSYGLLTNSAVRLAKKYIPDKLSEAMTEEKIDNPRDLSPKAASGLLTQLIFYLSAYDNSLGSIISLGVMNNPEVMRALGIDLQKPSIFLVSSRINEMLADLIEGKNDNKLYEYISSSDKLEKLKAAIASIDLEKYPFIKKEAISSTFFFLDKISRGVILQKELEKERQKGEDLGRKLSEAEKKISEMEEKTRSDELKIKQLIDEVKEKDRKISELDKELRVVKEAFEKRLKALEDDSEKKKKELNSALETLGVLDDGKRARIINSINEGDQRKIVEAFREAELDYTRFQEKIESISRELQSIEKEKSDLERKLEETLLELKNEKKDNIDRIRELEELLEALNAEKMALQGEFDEPYDASEDFASLFQEPESEECVIPESDLDGLQSELDKKEEELKAARDDLSKERQKLGEIKLQLSKLKKELAEKDSRIKELETESRKGVNASLENNVDVCYSFTDGNGNQKYPFPLTKNNRTLDPVIAKVRDNAYMKKDDPIDAEVLEEFYKKITADGVEVGIFGVLSLTKEGKQVITFVELGNASEGFKFELTLENGNVWILTSTCDENPGFKIHDRSTGESIDLEKYGDAITVKKKHLEPCKDIELADEEMTRGSDDLVVSVSR